MVMWDEIAEIVRRDFPAVDYRKYHVDALAARMVTHPQTLDVMVTSNLFGDILTDHGSAPDIAGKGIANPIGAMWAGALMLDHLGHRDGHDRILAAIERVVAGGAIKTPDLGGTSTTKQVTDAVVS